MVCPKCRSGSHSRSNHHLCPFNKKNVANAAAPVAVIIPAHVLPAVRQPSGRRRSDEAARRARQQRDTRSSSPPAEQGPIARPGAVVSAAICSSCGEQGHARVTSRLCRFYKLPVLCEDCQAVDHYCRKHPRCRHYVCSDCNTPGHKDGARTCPAPCAACGDHTHKTGSPKCPEHVRDPCEDCHQTTHKTGSTRCPAFIREPCAACGQATHKTGSPRCPEHVAEPCAGCGLLTHKTGSPRCWRFVRAPCADCNDNRHNTGSFQCPRYICKVCHVAGHREGTQRCPQTAAAVCTTCGTAGHRTRHSKKCERYRPMSYMRGVRTRSRMAMSRFSTSAA